MKLHERFERRVEFGEGDLSRPKWISVFKFPRVVQRPTALGRSELLASGGSTHSFPLAGQLSAPFLQSLKF